jgi:predicted PurR-regulated permease PerM
MHQEKKEEGMEFSALVKGALELGVIPALALFLVFAMHLQVKKLTSMLEKQEQNNMDVLKTLIKEYSEFIKIQFPTKGDISEDRE